jgi:signal transduction histidine kinase
MHSHSPTALPSTPSPGLSGPDEGVSHWLRRLLQSSTLEQGLALLLSWVEEPITHGSLALWVWPEPRIEALGLIGLSRYYESRREILGDRDPTDEQLACWSGREGEAPAEPQPKDDFPPAYAARQEPRPPRGTRFEVNRFRDAAILWECDSRPRMSPDEHAWISTLIEWLIHRETAHRDAKLASLAEFAAGAGHEINNPLGTILGRSQLLLRKETDPERRRSLSSIGGQSLRIRDMISDTMVFARPPAPRKQLVEIEPLLRRVIDRFTDELTASSIRLDEKHEPALHVLLDPEQFQVVAIELLRNAINAARTSGRIGLRTRSRSWHGQSWLELDLYNNGPELTQSEQLHAFDPFYSGRDAGRGLGFGLTKCWRILTSHGGRIGVHSTPLQTVFRCLWPLADAPST